MTAPAAHPPSRARLETAMARLCDVPARARTNPSAAPASDPPLVFWHGSRAWHGPPTVRPGRAKRSEGGPGIYLTTSYRTASGYAKGGEPCGVLDPATFRSCAGGTCVVGAGSAGAGTCVADVGAGAACDTGNDGAACMTGFRCAVSGDGGADAGSSGACVSPTSCK
ncbi:MAG TPA: hypothetical protein PK141_06990 [Polyangiaceae bacterium]|nr:hypothetical protein [Polyangiaceae bacterium]